MAWHRSRWCIAGDYHWAIENIAAGNAQAYWDAVGGFDFTTYIARWSAGGYMFRSFLPVGPEGPIVTVRRRLLKTKAQSRCAMQSAKPCIA